MREYRSEFCVEHGVWILKRVDCDAADDAQAPQTVPTVPRAAHLRVVETETALGN
ncbi:MAG: hypothetical protein ACE37F_36800 [Nannocystaceae bacterium]|nr:hypothetical protein [bacterium]